MLVDIWGIWLGDTRRMTGEQGRAGSNMEDKENPGGMGRDRNNPAGPQGTHQEPSDKVGPITPREIHRARGRGLVILGRYLVPGERRGEAVAVQVAAGAQVREADGLPAAHRRAPLAHGGRAAPHPPVAVPVIRRRHPGHRLLPAACGGGRTTITHTQLSAPRGKRRGETRPLPEP